MEVALDALAKRRLLIVSGKGGVGRSTTALVLAQALALRGQRVLLTTTGTDHRLAQLSGLDELSEQVQSVRPGLSILRLTAQRSVQEYAEMVLWSRRFAKALFENKVVRRLMAAIPGMEDFAVLGKVWHEATRADNYDQVIFDGPASGHLKTALRSPRSIADTLGQGPLATEAHAMLASLQDATKVGLVLVGLPQAWPLTELFELEQALAQDPGIDIAALVVNQMWSYDLPDLPPVPASMDPNGTIAASMRVLAGVRERAQADHEVVGTWREQLHGRAACRPLLEIPYAPAGLSHPSALKRLRESIVAHPQAGSKPDPSARQDSAQ